MEQTQGGALAAPRMEQGRALLIAGLREWFRFENLGGLPGLWQRFRDHIGLVPGQIGGVCYGVCYNTDDVGFDYIAGVEVQSFASLPAEYARVRVAEHRYAVFTHSEHVSSVKSTLMAIFNEWLPASGYQAADAPVFERYDERFDGRTGMGGFEIWVPVKG